MTAETTLTTSGLWQTGPLVGSTMGSSCDLYPLRRERRSPDGESHWTIDRTDLRVITARQGGRRRWMLSCDTPQASRWLAANGLRNQAFNSRKELRRAFDAAAAIHPPPAYDRPQVRLRRQPDGSYRSDQGFTVHRAGREWELRNPRGARIGPTATLRTAAHTLTIFHAMAERSGQQ